MKAPASVPLYDWSGLYFGGHVGYSRGSAQVELGDPDPTSFRKSFGSLSGGVQAGYNRVLPSRLLLGAEADLSFLNALSADELAWFRTTPDTDIAEKIEMMGTLRGRVGYAFDHWMVYATGGFAWSLGRFIQTPGVVDDTDRVLHLHTGWTAGAGTEVAIAPSWTLRLEYLYLNFGNADVVFPSGATAGSSYDIHTARMGLNYKIGGPGENAWTGNFGGGIANPVRQLGDPRTDHLHPAGLPGIPVALSRREQFHALGADTADLDRQRLSRPAAVGWRRALLQSGTAAGLRPAQHLGRRRLSQRRSAEVEFSISALQHVAPVRTADVWLGRRAGIGRKRVRPDGPETRRIAAHRPGRKIRRP